MEGRSNSLSKRLGARGHDFNMLGLVCLPGVHDRLQLAVRCETEDTHGDSIWPAKSRKLVQTDQ